MSSMAVVVPQPGDECTLEAAHCSEKPVVVAGAWVLAATILGSSIAQIDGTVVNVALPTMQRGLHATAADMQWVIEAYSLFLSSLILVGGSLGDRLGRRRIFALGLGIFTLTSVVCGLAPNVGILVGARAVQGIGGALLVPSSLAIISAAFAEGERGKAIGTWAGFSSITTAAGPVLGGWLVQHASWRAVFFINVPLALVTVFLLYRHVPESRDPASGALDWPGAVLVTGGLGAIVFALIEAGVRGVGDPLVIGCFVAGLVLLAVFVAREARLSRGGARKPLRSRVAPAPRPGASGTDHREPLVPLDIFRSRAFTGANLLTLLLYGALGGSLYFLPFNLQQVQGYSPTAAGAAFLPFPITVFLLSRWSGGLVSRFGARRPLIIGPLIAAAGFVLFAVPGIGGSYPHEGGSYYPHEGGSYWTTYFPAVVLLSVGMATVIAPLSTTVMNAVSTDRSGVASGVNNAVSRAAGLLAIAVLGLVVTATFDSSLDSRLTSLRVTPAVRHAIDAQRSRLVATPLPPSITHSHRPAEVRLAAELERALRESFIAGFRVAMLVGASLALGSALIAAWLIPGRRREEAARGVAPRPAASGRDVS